MFNQRHDVRQSRLGQDDTGGTLGHVGRRADGDAHFGLAERRSIIDAVARHAGDMTRSLQVLHHGVFVLWKYFRETIGTCEKINRLVLGLQVSHVPDVGQPDSLTDFTRDCQRVAGEHLHRNPEVVECGDELFGVRPGRIIQRHQSDQGRVASFGAARHRQHSISLQCGFADAFLQRFDGRGLKSTGFGEGSHRTFHHAKTLPVLFDHGFRPPIFRIKRREGNGCDLGKVIEDAPVFRGVEERVVNRVLIGFLRRECAREKHVRFRRVFQRNHAGDGQFVHRNCAGLIHAEHIHRRGILGGTQACDQHAKFRQFL